MPDGAGIPVENPATGETIATVPELGAEEVRGLVAARSRGAARLGRGRFRGSRQGAARRPPVDGRERRARRRHDRGGDRPAVDETHPLADETDRRTLKLAVEQLVRVHEAASAREIVGSGMRAPDWTRGDDLEAFVAGAQSASSSCRASTSPSRRIRWARAGWAATRETSVANPWGQLHDTPGVWIGDASAFPSASGTNPMATIMALARRTAHAIAAA